MKTMDIRNNFNVLAMKLAKFFFCVILLAGISCTSGNNSDRPLNPSGLELAIFDIDATPPVGSHMAYNPVINTWDLSYDCN